MVYRDRKGRTVVIRVLGHHLVGIQPVSDLLAHGHTDQSLAVCRHKIDVFRRGVFPGADEISFILAVRIICHQNDLSFLQACERFFD